MKTLSAKVKISGPTLIELLIVSAIIAVTPQAAAQSSQFFRISGPAATKITAFRNDGSLVWSNALAGTNYTIQTTTSLTVGNRWLDYVKIPVTSKINTNQIVAINAPAGMALIPAGVFTIGDTLDGETNAIPTNVTVSAFYMDVNLVNSNQWAAVYDYATNQGYGFVNAGLEKAPNHPVQSVDWFDCLKWSNARSQQAGLTPVYYTDAGFTQLFTNGDDGTIIYANWTAKGFRLPTEAEWEKAARGGLSGRRFPWGDTISWSQANYFGFPGSMGGPAYDLATATDWDPDFSGGDSGNYPYTSPVGYFAANGYGLYDMAGNVWQFCWDWYAAPPYPAGSPYLGGIDPRGPSSSPNGYRVLRGGTWNAACPDAGCACRDVDTPSNPQNTVGFRCVRGN
jgi:formylglycine-generating enzyme required for sulfatase activity